MSVPEPQKDTFRGTPITRRITTSIRGSFSQFAHGGQESACWTTQNGRINDILGVTELLDGVGDQASTQAILKNVYLTKVKVTLVRYTFFRIEI
jgi:hypothetical protein